MPDIIDIVLPTFFVILVGFLIGKFTRLSVSPLVDISLFVGIPALVIVSLLNKEIVLTDAAKIWAASFIIQIGCLLIAWLVFRILRQKHSGLYVPIAIMNTVNIPFPVIYLAFGSDGLAAATLFYIPSLLLVYTLGVYIMAGRGWKESSKEIFRLPVVYAAVIGLAAEVADFAASSASHHLHQLVDAHLLPTAHVDDAAIHIGGCGRCEQGVHHVVNVKSLVWLPSPKTISEPPPRACLRNWGMTGAWEAGTNCPGP